MSRIHAILLTAAVALVVSVAITACRQESPAAQSQPAPVAGSFDTTINENARRMLEEGRRIFRFDTFGSEDFWGGTLRLHEAIVGQKLGGVGPGVSPKTALSLGLKVDADALPADLVAAI